MNCTEFLDRLDDALADRLEAEVTAAMDAHRAVCPDCRVEHEVAVELRLRARNLAGSIEPGRDLWPDIARRIEAGRVVRPSFGADRPRALRGSWRLAAAVAAVLAAVALAYQLGRTQAPQMQVRQAPTAVSGELALAGFEAAAVLDLERQVATIRGQVLEVVANQQMDPGTVEVVMENLRLIDDAVARIEMALGEDPGNPRLTRQLAFAYRQELDLLRRVARLPADT